MAETAALVLCGGRSSRMGRAKAWLPWCGRTMVEHVVGVLAEVVDEVVVVTSAELELPALGARVVCDEEPELGPLGGLAVGLAAVSAPLCFVSGTDAPHLRDGFVRAVLASGRPAAPVIDGHVQTLAAAYPGVGAVAGDGATKARELLAAGTRRPLALLKAYDFLELHESDLPEIDSLLGFNTPAEYLEAVRKDAAGEAWAEIEFVGRPRMLAGCDTIKAPVGSLAEVLAHAPRSLELCDGDKVAPAFLVSLGGRDFVRDARLPVGPGERVVVLDASAGG